MIAIKPTTSRRTLISRVILFSFLWWILADGAASSWWFGVPAVLLAVIMSTVLLPPVTFSWYEFLRFMPRFLVRSLIGGADVARRAFHPRMPIAPDLVEYRLQLPAGLSRVFMINIVNLLPGTLSAELGEAILKVHVLDGRKDFLTELELVEQSVGRIFGISQRDSEGGE